MLSGTIVPYCGARLFVPEGHFCESILLDGLVPEYHLNEIFKKFIKPGQKVVDVGANIGFHTLSMRSLVGPSGKVYAIEADVNNVFCIKQSIDKSADSNIFLLPVAASDRSGIIPMMSSSNTNTVFSNLAESAGNALAVGVRLDDIINDKIDFIKLDIEGAEILAIAGMSKIMENRPLITSEFSPHNILVAHGFDRSLEYLDIFFKSGYDCYWITQTGDIERQESPESALEKQRWARENMNSILIDLLFVPSERPLEHLLNR